jgi:hypothetical protein
MGSRFAKVCDKIIHRETKFRAETAGKANSFWAMPRQLGRFLKIWLFGKNSCNPRG